MATPEKQTIPFAQIHPLIVGKITHIEGAAVAVSPDGHARNLTEGSAIFINDVIKATGTGETTIRLVNGSVYTMPSGSSVHLNTESLKSITSLAFPETHHEQAGGQHAYHVNYSGEMGFVTSGFLTHACGYAGKAAAHAQQVVGTVHCAVGFVTAVGANGETRLLSAGDQIYAGDVITSSDNSMASIVEANGNVYDVNSGQSMEAGACSDYSSNNTVWFDQSSFANIEFLGMIGSVSSGFETSGGLGPPAPPPPPPPPPVGQSADVAISITHVPTNAVIPGTTDPFILTITNFGPDPVTNATIVDALPTGMFANITATGLPAGAQFINLNNGTFEILNFSIAQGQVINIVLDGTVDPNLRAGTNTFLDAGSISLPANIHDPNPANNSSVSLNNVTPQANLSLTMSDSVSASTPGTTDTYQVTLSSTGPSNLTNVVIIDTLPTGLTNVSSPGLPAGVTFTNLGNGQVEWSGIIIASGQNIPLELTGTVNPSLAAGTGTFINSASVIVQPGDTNTNATTSTSNTTNVTPQAHMTITTLADGHSSEVVNVGQTVNYTISLGNIGPSDATAVQVQDILSSLTGISFNLSSATVNVGTLSTAGGNLTWNLSSVGVNGVDLAFAPTLSITGIVTGTPPTISNTATVTAADSTTASSTATISINADVGIAKTVSVGDTVSPNAIGSVTVTSGQDVTYQLTAFNNGGNTATHVVTVDNLPANFNLNTASFLLNNVSISAANLAANGIVISGNTITWTVASLNAGANSTLTYTETTNAPGTIQVDPNSVSITSNQTNTFGDATPQDNGYTGNVTVIPQENITITNSDGKTNVIPGTPDTYTITVTNNGLSPLSNGTVVDIIPAGFSITGQTSNVGGVTFTNLGNGQVEWTGLNLANGATATFTLTGNIDPNLTQGTYTNIAQAFVPAGQINSNVTYTATDTNNLNPTADLTIKTTDTTNNIDGTNGTFNPATNSTTGGVAVPGSTSSEVYTVVVSNSGPSNITGIPVTDIFPAGFTNAQWTVVLSGGATINGNQLSGSGDINQIVNLPSGSSITYTIDGTILSGTTAPLIDTASLGTPVGVTNTNTFTSSTDIVSLQPEAFLIINKTDNTNTVIPGTTDNYVITIDNTLGPSNITNGTIVDTLPIGLLNATSTDANFINLGNGTVEWTGINVAAGTSLQLHLSGTVDPNLSAGTGTFTDTAVLTVPQGQVNTNGANNTATDTNNVSPQVDLSVTKTDGVTAVIPGTSDTYTITVSNSGPSNANGTTVIDTLPIGLLNVTSPLLPPGVTFTNLGNGQVEWSGLNIASGHSVQLTLTGNVDPSLAAGTNTFVDTINVNPAAGITDTNTTNNTFTDTNSVTPQANLSITKLVDGHTSETANIGQDVIFTIQVTNSGPSFASNLNVNDLLPPGLTFLNDILPAGTAYNPVTGVWTIGSLANGASDTLVIQAQVSTIGSSVPSSINETATATATDASTVSSTAVVNVNADVGINKTVSAGDAVNSPSSSVSVGAGHDVTYQLTAFNNGGNTANNVVVTDNLPTNFTLNNTTFLLNNVSISAADLAANGIVISGNTITWTVSSLNAGANSTLTYTETTNAPSTAQADPNSVSITSNETNQFGDATPADNGSASNVVVNPVADLGVTKTDGVTTVIPGTTDTYTIHVTNSGPSAVFGATVTDTLPTGLTNVTSTGLPAGVTFTVNQDGTAVTWSGLNIANGGTVNLQLQGTVDPNLPAGTNTFIDHIVVTPPAGVSDPNSTNNTATDTNSVLPEASLSVTKLVDGQTSEVANLGQIVTYTIQISNGGPSTATGVSVNDLLPAGLLLIGDTTPAGTSYNPITGVWTIGTLNSGATDTLTVVAQVTTIGNTVPSTITDTATGTAIDSPSSSSSATITVNADVGITKTVSAGDAVSTNAIGSVTVGAGQDVTYQLTAFNNGGNSATGVTVVDNLPPNFNLNTASFMLNNVLISAANLAANGIHISGNTITWDLSGSLAAGAQQTLSYTEATNAPGTIQVDPNSVSITSNETNQYGDATPQDNGYIGNATVIPQENISITNTDSKTNVIPGTADTYTITVTNGGPSPMTNGTVVDTIPAGFTITGQTSSVGGVTFTNLGNGQVEWTGLNLANGAIATFTLTGNIDPNLPQGTYTNIAQVSVPAGQIDTNVNYTATDTNNLNPTANISVKTTDSGNFISGTFNPTNNDTTGGTAIPGNSTTYTVVVTNNGPSNVTDVHLSDLLPTGISSDSWSALLSAGASNSLGISGTGNINDTISLASGSSITYTILANISAGATATLNNTASVAMPVGLTDTNAFQSSTDTLALLPSGGISVTNTDNKTTESAGSTDTYLITVTNTGPSNITGVKIVDTLPTGILATLPSGSPLPAGSPASGFLNVTSPNLPSGVQFINLGNGQVEWLVSDLNSLQTLQLQLVGLVSPSLISTTTFTNTATVSVPPGEVNTNTNPTTITVADTNAVTPIADLHLLNLVDGLPATTVTQGSFILYTIQVTNDGAISATGVNVSNPFASASLQFVSETTTAGLYNLNTGVWNVGTLATGQTETLTIEAISNASATTTATATATNAATVSSTVVLTDPPAIIFPKFLGVIDVSSGQILTGNNNNNSNPSNNTGSYNGGNNTSVGGDKDDDDSHHHNSGHGEHDCTDALKFDSVIDGHDYIKQFHDNLINASNHIDIDGLLKKMHESAQHEANLDHHHIEHNANNNPPPDANPKGESYAKACAFTYASLLLHPSEHHPLNNEEHNQHIHHVA